MMGSAQLPAFVKDVLLKKLTKYSTIGALGKRSRGTAWKDTSVGIVAHREIDPLNTIGDHNFLIKTARIPASVNVAGKR
jgi:hypothetical protein